MDFVKSQFDRIQQQLAGLSASQKMLAACLVAIIVMTMAWMGGQAGTAEMEPLFDQALSPEESGRMKRRLAAEGIKATVTSDNRLAVPAAQHSEALAALASAKALPKNPRINFAAFMKGLNPFAPQSTNDAHLNYYKQTAVAEMIMKIDGVSEAEVIIDPTRDVRMGGGIDAAASVHITTDEGVKPTQDLANAAVMLVCGAQATLKPERVSLTINDKPWTARDADDDGLAAAPAQLELLQLHQKRIRDEIVDHIRIPGLSVFVHCELITESKLTRTRTVDRDSALQKEKSTKERTTESNTPGAGGGEPGVIPNGPLALGAMTAAGAAGAGATASETESESEYVVDYNVKQEEIKTPAGETKAKRASVRVPRSYLVNIIKGAKADAPEPDDKAVDAVLAEQATQIRNDIKNCTDIDDDSNVSVAMYYDRAPPAAAPGGGRAAVVSSSTVAALAGAHPRELVLGGLAVISLFMVSMMVRKGGPVAVALPAGVGGMIPMPVLDASEQLAGEVSEGKSMLDAMELDEDAVRAQQMVDQVAAMVEDNPDAAAGLVKRWMSRT